MKSRRKRIQNKEKTVGQSIRLVLIGIAMLLVSIGLVFVFEASSIRALNATGDSFYFLKLQVRWIAIGLVAFTFFSIFNYKNLYYLSVPIMFFVIILLIAVLIPGIGKTAGGAQSWIDLGIINIQPAEFAKFAFVLYLSSWFSKKEKGRFLPFIFLLGFVLFLIMMQPDMGTAVMLFALGISIYILAGEDIRFLFLIAPVAILGFVGLVMMAPYRLARLTAFLHPENDPLGVGFHINQILISFSEGGIIGRGFGASRQKYLFLPEAHTDSIFAIIAEEMGFIGGMFLIILFVVFLYKLYQIFAYSKDKFAKILIGGIFTYFALQIVINLGGMVNIMPLTGVTLPFISYGGSSMIISFVLLGIAVNISRQTSK